MNKIKITEPVFNTEVHIYTEGSCAEFYKLISRKIDVSGDNDVIDADGLTVHNGKDFYIFIKKELDINTLMHELGHVAIERLISAGVEDQSGESICYLLGFLAEESLKRLKYKVVKNG